MGRMPAPMTPISYPAECLVDLYNNGVISRNELRNAHQDSYKPYVPQVKYEPNVVTGLENVMWWVQPTFALIVFLLGLAVFLAVKH